MKFVWSDQYSHSNAISLLFLAASAAESLFHFLRLCESLFSSRRESSGENEKDLREQRQLLHCCRASAWAPTSTCPLWKSEWPKDQMPPGRNSLTLRGHATNHGPCPWRSGPFPQDAPNKLAPYFTLDDSETNKAGTTPVCNKVWGNLKGQNLLTKRATRCAGYHSPTECASTLSEITPRIPAFTRVFLPFFCIERHSNLKTQAVTSHFSTQRFQLLEKKLKGVAPVSPACQLGCTHAHCQGALLHQRVHCCTGSPCHRGSMHVKMTMMAISLLISFSHYWLTKYQGLLAYFTRWPLATRNGIFPSFWKDKDLKESDADKDSLLEWTKTKVFLVKIDFRKDTCIVIHPFGMLYIFQWFCFHFRWRIMCSCDLPVASSSQFSWDLWWSSGFVKKVVWPVWTNASLPAKCLQCPWPARQPRTHRKRYFSFPAHRRCLLPFTYVFLAATCTLRGDILI